jgi:hypothetical protein
MLSIIPIVYETSSQSVKHIRISFIRAHSRDSRAK